MIFKESFVEQTMKEIGNVEVREGGVKNLRSDFEDIHFDVAVSI